MFHVSRVGMTLPYGTTPLDWDGIRSLKCYAASGQEEGGAATVQLLRVEMKL